MVVLVVGGWMFCRKDWPLRGDLVETKKMRLLVSGNTRQVCELAACFPKHLGFLMAPNNGNRGSILESGLPWAADNGAFSGFDAERFRRFLAAIALQPGCLFVVCPDVVGDARATLEMFGEWALEVRTAGHPIAFVGQDGAEGIDIPWADFDSWFIGGSTRWKLSQASVDLVAEAKMRGKWVHCGRVNSMKRLRWAMRIGCDSCDGSSYSRFHHRTITHRPDMSLERHLRFLVAEEANERRQGTLFGGPAA